MTNFKDEWKEDSRPKCGRWAPGKYLGKCRKCGSSFIGDKRASWCADCAYAEPVAWQYMAGIDGWKQCPAEVVASYRQSGICIRPLFLAPPAPALPEGWRAVPVEPTQAMMDAWAADAPDEVQKGDWRGMARWDWSAMLAAAPEPPANSQGSLDGSADRESPVGWLFFNPDAGVEFSENHPIESGEVTDAENIREATSETLLEELLSAWKDWEEDRQILDEYKNAAADPVKAQLVEALKPFAAQADSFDEYSEPSAGVLQPSFCDHTIGDLRRARAALAAAEENSQIPVDTP